MARDSDSLMMESGVTAPRRGKSASLKAHIPVKLEAHAGANHVLLERLLSMAQRYRSEGNVREAMGLYWKLAGDHPGTAEADAAGAMLLELAASYERNDAPHMARSIYERLLADGAG